MKALKPPLTAIFYSWIFVFLILGLSGLVPEVRSIQLPERELKDPFQLIVEPFLKENCIFCHNKELKMAGLQLDVISESGQMIEKAVPWETVLEKLYLGEMPPADRPRPNPESIGAVVKWIKERNQIPGVIERQNPGRVTVRRLNRTEYNNTIRDLVGVDLSPAKDFPIDDSGYGFDNIGDVLSLPPILMEKYMVAAETIAKSAIVVYSPPVPTLVKYLAPRVQESDEFFPDGAYRVSHNFSVGGEYELRIRVVDRRYRLKEDQPPPPMPAPGILAIFLDGEQVGSFEIEPDKYERGTLDLVLDVAVGEHELFADFLSYGLDGPNQVDDPSGRMDGERKIFVDSFQITGPLKVHHLPLPNSHKTILFCGDPRGGYQPDCARQILEQLLPRAYRRPVQTWEIESLLQLVAQADQNGDSFAHGIRLALEAILVSPHFLFRIEQDSESDNPNQPHEINPYELAVRISYFLWSSMPDDELFRVAETGELNDPKMRAAQVHRMLDHPSSKALVENFAGQWLQFRNLENIVPDPDLFPDFDVNLRTSMQLETELFVEAVIGENLSILDLLDARFTFLNERLARHYKVEGVKGDYFRRVELDGVKRAGILTHASLLTVSSYPTRTSPVLRGKWLLENILGTPPPEPPAGIPELDETKVGLDGTLREQLEQHRSNPACAACHAKMDALGFGLENYNAVGAWRTQQGKFAIDASATLPGGKSFSGPGQLRAILVDQGEDFARCLTKKMLTYALGRGLESYDRPSVEGILRQLRESNYRFSHLILEIIDSVPFRMRRGEKK